MIKVAMIDDHELVLQGLVQYLSKEEEMEIIGAFTTIPELLLCLKYKSVDILVMDFRLKDKTAFEVIEEIKKIHLNIPKMILVSGFYEPLLHKRALEYGIHAFLPKECSYVEVKSTIYNVFQGNHIIPDDILNPQEQRLLTDTEKRVLELITKEYSNEKISKEMFISRRTVDTHVSNICSKLQVNSRVGAVREAIRLHLVD